MDLDFIALADMTDAQRVAMAERAESVALAEDES